MDRNKKVWYIVHPVLPAASEGTGDTFKIYLQKRWIYTIFVRLHKHLSKAMEIKKFVDKM